jgi:hypothetical protein
MQTIKILLQKSNPKLSLQKLGVLAHKSVNEPLFLFDGLTVYDSIVLSFLF